MSAIKIASVVFLGFMLYGCKVDVAVEQAPQEEPVLSYAQQFEQRVESSLNHVRRSCMRNNIVQKTECIKANIGNYEKENFTLRTKVEFEYKKFSKDWYQLADDRRHSYSSCVQQYKGKVTMEEELLRCHIVYHVWMMRHIEELHAGLWSQPTGVASQQSADYLSSIPESNSEQYEGD